MARDEHSSVLIVGAGPSGLVLANVLASQDVDFLLVDRKAGPVRQSRAALVHVRTLELLHRLGLAGHAVARGVPTDRVEVYQQGRPVVEFPLVGKGAEARTPFPYALGLEQDRTEQLLVEGLAAHGREVAWDTELVTLTDQGNAFRAVVRRTGGAEHAVLARWVVGADGAHSRVRQALGLGLVGTTYQQTGLLADVDLDLPAATTPGPGVIRLHLTRGGFVGMLRLGSGRWRLFGAVPLHLAPSSTRSEISHEAYAQVRPADLQRWLDDYFRISARLRHTAWTALFRIHSRIAPRFRVGNAFLVGDAAHIHSPAGGQGMNLGIGDAVNLGWKLALVAKGQARQQLLHSYQAERYPVAKAVLRGSDRGFAMEATHNPAVAWVRAHLAPHLLGPLLQLRTVQALIFRLFSQTWISYPASPAVTVTADHQRNHGPRPGDRAPHGTFTVPGGGVQNVFDVTAGIRHDLLLFEGPKPHPAPDTYRQAVQDVLDRYGIDTSVHVIAATETSLHRIYGATRPCFVLIRPDGHVSATGPLTDLRGLAAHMDALYHRMPGVQEEG